MSNNYHPTVPINYIIEQIELSDKAKITRFGSTTAIVKLGSQAMHKRIIMIRDVNGDGTMSFDKATALAINYSFLPTLMDWLLENRSWKEGDFTMHEN